MNFELFVIPFNIGLYFIIFYVVYRSVVWFLDLSRQDKLRLQRGFFGRAFWQSIKEIFSESLLHRKIWKTNARLGYMHTSLAFGWFLLIIFGTIEADLFGTSHLNPPYKAIFFKYFHPEPARSGIEVAYAFLMDLILAYILSGLFLAVLKRFSSKSVGMKKTTKLLTLDKVALTSLWLVFPSRLLAESFTSGAYGSGSFLTGSLGNALASFLPAEQLAYPFWWLYSLSLGTFFILLPLTRYMHIPIELFLIFARNSGIKTGDQKGSYTDIQIYSCSSCGICIDACQLSFSAGINNIQTTYLLKGIRENIDVTDIVPNCLMCGRCEAKCPVGIEIMPIRMIQRRENIYLPSERKLLKRYFPDRKKSPAPKPPVPPSYSWIPEGRSEKAKVIYFAGCMSHLTPTIKKSMLSIFEAAGVDYTFVDEEGGVCCGRPLMLSGQTKKARELISYNSKLFYETGADMLVTSCPICYKVFKESYKLGIDVMHHTQYIKKLINDDALKLNFMHKTVSYHSPCDLGRGSGVYDEPKYVLSYVARLQETEFEDENSLCCGGSLANTKIDNPTRTLIAKDAARELTKNRPDYLVTACPLCKKTFGAVTETDVVDISELVAQVIVVPQAKRLMSNSPIMRKKKVTVKNNC